jgi:hypothetical protein
MCACRVCSNLIFIFGHTAVQREGTTIHLCFYVFPPLVSFISIGGTAGNSGGATAGAK